MLKFQVRKDFSGSEEKLNAEITPVIVVSTAHTCSFMCYIRLFCLLYNMSHGLAWPKNGRHTQAGEKEATAAKNKGSRTRVCACVCVILLIRMCGEGISWRIIKLMKLIVSASLQPAMDI